MEKIHKTEKFFLDIIGIDKWNQLKSSNEFNNIKFYKTYKYYRNKYNLEIVSGSDWIYNNKRYKYGSIKKENIYVDNKNNIKLKPNTILYYVLRDEEDDGFQIDISKAVFCPILYKDIPDDEISKININFKEVKLKYTLHNPYKMYNNYLFCHTPENYSSVIKVDVIYQLYNLGIFDERIVSIHNSKNHRGNYVHVYINNKIGSVKVKSYELYSYGYCNDLSYSWHPDCSKLESINV